MHNITTIPIEIVKDLDLHDGDIVEGVTQGRKIALRLVQRKIGDRNRATNIDRWLEKWSGAFSEPANIDPRLDYLIKKHLNK